MQILDKNNDESTPLIQVDKGTGLGKMPGEENGDISRMKTNTDGKAEVEIEYDIYTASGGHIAVKSEGVLGSIPGPRTTNTECLMHLLKGNMGVGILAMPVAYKNGGLWLSMAFVTIIGIICVHCMHILVKCKDELCRRTQSAHLDYASVMEKSFEFRNDRLKNWSNFARTMVNMFLVTTQLGLCCTYTVFIAENIKQIVEYADLVTMDTKLYIVIVSALLVPYSMVKTLKILAPFSALANMMNLWGFIMIFVNLCQDLPGTETRRSVAELENLPLFFGQVVFAFEGISLVLPLQKKMKDQDAFLGKAGVLNLGLTIVIALDNAVGFYGYLKYGEDTEGSITLNLPQDQWLYLSVKLIFALSIFLSYAIQFYVPVNIIWSFLEMKAKKNGSSLPPYAEYALRLTLVLLTCGLSVLIPHLDLLIALIGACESSVLALILPAIIELITFECSWAVRVKNALIMALGLVGCVIGTYSSVVEIVRTF